MKPIIYLLIAIFISSILVSAFPKTFSKQSQTIKIECIEKDPVTDQLNKALKIIDNRLKDFGLKKYKLNVDTLHHIISLTYIDDTETFELESLLTSCGKLEFYETVDRSIILKLIENDTSLRSLIKMPETSTGTRNSSAILGTCNIKYYAAIEPYLMKNYNNIAGQKIKYSVNFRPDPKGLCNLYVLKQPAVINKSTISKVHITNDAGGRPGLMIDFDKNGQAIWQAVTGRNIGKMITAVLDDKVYFAPEVMEEIKKGKCQITGSFTVNELKCLKALIINPELPLDFKIKE